MRVVYLSSSHPKGLQGSLYATRDGGAHWRFIGPDFRVAGGISDIAISPSAPGRLYANSYYYAFRSDDGGRSWTKLEGGGLPEYTLGQIVVSPRNPNVLFMGSGEGVLRSSDGGGSWQPWDRGMSGVYATLLTRSGSRLYSGTYGAGVAEREI